jgi:hypothetical protein
MHRTVVLVAVGLVYYALATYGLFVFGSGLLATSIVLFGVPAYLLARYSAAPSAVLVSVVVFGAGISVLLEGIAHIYGIWYTIGVDELRLFGIIPLEVIATSITQTLFLALLYELIFDDGEYSEAHISTRLTAFGIFAISGIALVCLHVFFLQYIFFGNSYVWVLITLIGATLTTLAITDSLSLRFFDRLSLFTLVASIPLFCSLLLALLNTHKVFAYTNDYFYTFILLGNTVPLEEVLLTLALPLFVATFYEVYLDDGK